MENQELTQEFTWRNAIMVFWAIAWRTILYAFPIITLMSMLLISIYHDLDTYAQIQKIITYAQYIFLFVYLSVLKRLFNKGFGRYHLVLNKKSQHCLK